MVIQNYSVIRNLSNNINRRWFWNKTVYFVIETPESFSSRVGTVYLWPSANCGRISPVSKKWYPGGNKLQTIGVSPLIVYIKNILESAFRGSA